MSVFCSLPNKAFETSRTPLNEPLLPPARPRKWALKVRDSFWTLGPYDVVLLLEAPDDQSVTAFNLKLGSLGNVKTQTMRAFRSEEMDGILAKIK
jgi:uncharacterized protein with GYD domain